MSLDEKGRCCAAALERGGAVPQAGLLQGRQLAKPSRRPVPFLHTVLQRVRPRRRAAGKLGLGKYKTQFGAVSGPLSLTGLRVNAIA